MKLRFLGKSILKIPTKSLPGSASMHKKELDACAITHKWWVKVDYFNLFMSTSIQYIFLIAPACYCYGRCRECGLEQQESSGVFKQF